MKTVPEGIRSEANRAEMPGARAATRTSHAFHVELTPVAVDARPFHAVHGVPGAAVTGPLPSHWDPDPIDPAPAGEIES